MTVKSKLSHAMGSSVPIHAVPDNKKSSPKSTVSSISSLPVVAGFP